MSWHQLLAETGVLTIQAAITKHSSAAAIFFVARRRTPLFLSGLDPCRPSICYPPFSSQVQLYIKEPG